MMTDKLQFTAPLRCCKEHCRSRLMCSRRVPCRMIRAIIAFSLLPSVAGFFLLSAHAIAEGSPLPIPLPYAETVEHLAGQSVAYWFLALAAISIFSWTWILKWIINQLEQQRAANAEITARLLTYMERDHADMKGVLVQVTAVLQQVSNLLRDGHQ